MKCLIFCDIIAIRAYFSNIQTYIACRFDVIAFINKRGNTASLAVSVLFIQLSSFRMTYTMQSLVSS